MRSSAITVPKGEAEEAEATIRTAVTVRPIELEAEGHPVGHLLLLTQRDVDVHRLTVAADGQGHRVAGLIRQQAIEQRALLIKFVAFYRRDDVVDLQTGVGGGRFASTAVISAPSLTVRLYCCMTCESMVTKVTPR